ncbi:phosphorylase b kinase regulatory subunit beta-like [Ascaphus truei]|uniref:phosphorylase b kinase regulatory subunit beta-like n=1 Tax=Ascaphus truei TaxID=8439 RepID=UPI003F5A381B
MISHTTAEVLSPPVTSQAYLHLGINDKLGLSGRPDRPIGCLGTSKIYRILGKTVVCYPIVFDLSDFYMSQDVMLLIDDIQNALQFIKQYWKMNGRPLFLVLIREDNIRGSRFNPILDMLASFKKGNVAGVKVHVDRLQVRPKYFLLYIYTQIIKNCNFLVCLCIFCALMNLPCKCITQHYPKFLFHQNKIFFFCRGV